MEPLESLIEDLNEMGSFDERIIAVYNDIKSKKFRFRPLAEYYPYRLFEILGGDPSAANRRNWAMEYTYEDHLECSGEEYDVEKGKSWNLEEESINQALSSAHWYVTGLVSVVSREGHELIFEIDFSEGYFDSVIGTPYDEDIGCKVHGFEFF
jgi:hypothetical protein